jgi:hypothetical protein
VNLVTAEIMGRGAGRDFHEDPAEGIEGGLRKDAADFPEARAEDIPEAGAVVVVLVRVAADILRESSRCREKRFRSGRRTRIFLQNRHRITRRYRTRLSLLRFHH